MDTSLTPDVIAAIDDLEIAARVIVDGAHAGGHRSPLLGAGSEFQQHRPYRAGDDLRHLDWKLYARSNRLFTRQFLETTDLTVQLVVDTSRSMAYPPTGMSKLRYAKVLAASLAHLVVSQGSSVGLVIEGADGLAYTPARGGTQHRRSLIARLDAAAPVRSWTASHAVRNAAALLKRRGIVVVISDFYDDELAALDEMRAAAYSGHDVIMLQLLSDSELTLAVDAEHALEDAESGERREVNPAAVRAAYARDVGAFVDRCREGARGAGIDYALVRTSVPPSDTLRDLLLRRSR